MARPDPFHKGIMITPPSKDRRAADKVAGKKILTAVWKKQQIEYVEGELIVKLSNEKKEDKSAVDNLLAKELKGAKVVRPIDRFGVGLFEVSRDVIALCKTLEANPSVAFAEPNMVDRAAVTVPNDTEYAARQWPLPLIGMPQVWDHERGQPTVLIAILDSGIPMQGTPLALSHPDLNDTTRIILGSDLVNGTATPRDDCGHGTHVAGIAAAQSNNAAGITGMAWDTHLYIVKVFDSGGSGSSQRFHDAVVEAVDYAQAHGYRLVLNYSGGGGAATLKEQAVQYAQSHNAVLVCAAGNDYGGSVSWPAAYASTYNNVIAVSATDSADALASYSNIGAAICVAAPGTHVYSCLPNYAVTMNTVYGYSQNYDYVDGTSMAAPHVTGLAALLLSADSTLTPDDVRRTIEDTAVDLGTPGWDQSFGHGRIDAHSAIDAVDPTVCLLSKELCFYKLEGCKSKEFCLYVQEVGGCRFIRESKPCIFNRESGPCTWIIETGPCIALKEVACLAKVEAFGPCVQSKEAFCTREMCLREAQLPGAECMREGFQVPWGEIMIRKGDPNSEPMILRRRLRHLRTLTRQAPLSRRNRG